MAQLQDAKYWKSEIEFIQNVIATDRYINPLVWDAKLAIAEHALKRCRRW